MTEPYLETLKATIEDLRLPISKEVHLVCKHFFSGAALYANGQICASLTPAGFGIKLPEDIRDQIIDNGNGKPLRYFDNSPIKKEYVVISNSIENDPGKLEYLLGESIKFVISDQ